ncbi:calcium-binding protein 39-like [Apostichopus japonicus]|uniref:calcium-binding protein 39-like n=1 Tax=Stichopus japonicus TaxID=307972 RepID=UPI003AB6A6A7
MPLFGKSKGSSEWVKSLTEGIQNIEAAGTDIKKKEKRMEEVSKCLAGIKNVLYGSGDQEPQVDNVTKLALEIYETDTIFFMVSNLKKVDFEAKKDVAQIYNNLMRRVIGIRYPTVEHITNRPETLILLVEGYDDFDIALNCGLMLRESIRHEPLAKVVLHSEHFYRFFKYVEMSTFDIASDAFSTFKELLTRHKIMCAEFLEKNYDEVFKNYEGLLNSTNYVTRRQSLKLLGELLLDRHNFSTMTRYISNPENLKLMMTLLRDKSRNIQFEAFHVFKVFVANPNKSQATLDILLKNKDKLVEFLLQFHTDRTEDDQFNDEKNYLIRQIRELKSS